MKKPFKLFKFLAVPLVLLFGCYPEHPIFVEDYDAVYTLIGDREFDFSDPTIQKFYLADTVMVLTDPNSSPTNIAIDHSLLLNRVRQNMLNAGYTEITDPLEVGEADYLVLVSVSRADNYFLVWWGGWGGWGGWGWGGWGFPPMVSQQNIRTGALIVELVNARELDADPDRLPVVWRGMGEGLFRGSVQNLTNRALGAIDQMFIQSPYLNR